MNYFLTYMPISILYTYINKRIVYQHLLGISLNITVKIHIIEVYYE